MARKGRKSYIVGVDLGGTKILTALINKKGEIVAQVKQATDAEAGPERVIARIADSVERTLRKAEVAPERVLAVGVGAPGPLNPDTGIILNAPNLPGWVDVPLAEHLRDKTKLPVFVENDVNAGTYGEFKLGAGRGVSDLVGIFVGTGIGGGLILGGQLRSGFRHVAAEVGHMIVVADGPRCGCGALGCLEAVASRTAITRDLVAAINAGRTSILTVLAGDKLDDLTSGVLSEAAQRGDPLTLEVLARAQHYLGLAVASIINLIDPEMVILGGGVVEALGEGFLGPVRETAYANLIAKHDLQRVKIVAAELGDHAGVLGAAMLAMERVGKRK